MTAERAGTAKGRPFQFQFDMCEALDAAPAFEVVEDSPADNAMAPDALAGRGGLWLYAGEFVLHIGTEQNFVAPKRAHPGVLVDDLPAMIETLRAKDVELTFDIPLPGYDRVHIRDPFGNRIELLQRV